jgi:PIN domain nuclease of toxin-antitoxin system
MKELAPVLDLGAPGFLDAARESGLEVLEITLDHAAATASLSSVHRDPFDRMIAGQALVDRMTVMTSDPIFRRYKGVRVFDT